VDEIPVLRFPGVRKLSLARYSQQYKVRQCQVTVRYVGAFNRRLYLHAPKMRPVQGQSGCDPGEGG
jgi:hypothetical protein